MQYPTHLCLPFTRPPLVVTASPWGKKAFENYLGSVEAGKAHVATLLLEKMDGKAVYFDRPILIDVGTDDEYLQSGQLLIDDFEKAAEKVGQKLEIRRQAGFDHSYHFIAAFISDHIAYHASELRRASRALARQKAEAEEASVRVNATEGKPIKCKAMVARAAKQPLSLEDITVDPPKANEVRVKVIANALCHTDIYTLGKASA